MLNYMLNRARGQLETVNVKIILPKGIEHSFDINIIMGNLLENAIRAAKESGEKLLNVRVHMKRGVLLVEVENSFCRDALVGEKDAAQARKGDHGIGLHSVRKIVEKHNGIMEVFVKENLFCVKLMLYL